MNSIFTRRSIRKFKDTPISKGDIEKLLRAGMQAPSALNQQPWEFIVVQDKEMLSRLSTISPYAKLIANSSVTIVLLGTLGDIKLTDMWQQDLAACTQNILLQATELDLGAVWLGVAPVEERQDFLIDLFNLKEGLLPFGMISLGHPEDTQANKFVDRYNPNKVHFEEYK